MAVNQILEPLGFFGMFLINNRAVSINSISMVTLHQDETFELLLINGEIIKLDMMDSTTFADQIKLIGQQIKFGALQIKHGKN